MQRHLTLSALTILIITCSSYSADKNKNYIESLLVEEKDRYTNITIQSSSPLNYDIFQEKSPPQIYLKITDKNTYCNKDPIELIDTGVVQDIKYEYSKKGRDEEWKRLEYILIKLNSPAVFTDSQRDWILLVSLKGTNETVPATATDYDSNPSYSAGYLGSIGLPDNPKLNDFIDVALTYNRELKVAKKDYKLSKLRFHESWRNLLPSVTGKIEKTEGTTKDDDNFEEDFTREERGVQLAMPLFQSGKHIYTLKQAMQQKQISKAKIEKTRYDIIFEVTKAYHNFIKSIRTLNAREDLYDRAKKILDTSEKARKLRVITKVEHLNVASQYNQILYKYKASKKDLEIAKLRLLALLNIEGPLPNITPPPKEDTSSFPKIQDGLEPLISQAYVSQPEIKIAEATLKFHKYGRKIAYSDGKFRIEGTGFLGESGGAYEGETLKFEDSWNVNVKASTYFWGNTFSGTHSSDKTSPQLGESSRTKSKISIYTVGLLDAIPSYSNRRQADISYEKALGEVEQARKNVEIGVKEAYFNYEKARMQLESAEQEIEFRKKQRNIAYEKSRLRMAEKSEVLQASSSYTEALTSYEEAVAFYKISIVALEKAVGTSLSY